MPSALIDSIETHFKILNDPRRETLNKQHKFIDILVIAMCGAISGANYWTSIAAYGRSKEAWFKTFLELPNGIPSHDTFNDVFMKLDAKKFEQCFISWTSSISELLPGEVVSVDGKTLRCSHDTEKNAIHMVSAWSTSNALVLGQIQTEEKSNEITAIPELLKILSIEKCLVSIDAMGCQKKIAETILSKNADYLLAVKENQPKLYESIRELFLNHSESSVDSYSEQKNKGHGREEIRRCWVSHSVDELNMDTTEWKSLRSLIVVLSEVVKNSKKMHHYRFYISSKKHSADYFLSSVRDHWHIENKLHWSLDVSFREDESRLRKGDGAENFSILRRIALNLLRKEKTDKHGIETKRQRSGWDNDYLKLVLSGLTA